MKKIFTKIGYCVILNKNIIAVRFVKFFIFNVHAVGELWKNRKAELYR